MSEGILLFFCGSGIVSVSGVVNVNLDFSLKEM